jgi:hypothetical protein
MNKMNYYMVDDPREKTLRDAVYRAIAVLGAHTSPRHARLPREHSALSLTSP